MGGNNCNNRTKKIDITYCPGNIESTEFNHIFNLIPLKIIYDNLYGRSYLFAICEEKIITLRLDRIFQINLGEKFDKDYVESRLKELNETLKTAWLVSTNETAEHVVIRFTNSPSILERVKNEGRHGHISKQNKNYFIYEIDVNDSLEMTSWVLTYGSQCKVMEPPRFVEKIVEHLKGMAK